MIAGAFDLLLVGGLVGLAAVLLFSADLFRAIVLFIVFGLLMALAWARLRAPDLALAEAAVGSGITGALLLAAWRRVAPDAPTQGRGPAKLWLAAAPAAALAVVAFTLITALGEAAAPGLEDQVQARLGDSGVRSPVTAVLLNFRGYDTLLEVTVLLLAAVAVRLAGSAPLPDTGPAGPVLRGFAAWLAPVLVVAAGYLLWRGGHAPGGAFQAGALLAAAGILVLLVYPGRGALRSEGRLRAALVLGPLLFLTVAALATLGGNLLQYPAGWAGALILLIEAAATLSIAAALLVLFVAAAGDGGEGQP